MTCKPRPGRICANCGNEFVGYHTKKFCSDECIKDHRRKNGIVCETHCLKCGKELVGVQMKFCSVKCKTTYNTKYLYGSRYCNTYYSTLTGYIKHLLSLKKNIRSALSEEFIASLYEKQDGMCALTGLKMTTVRGSGRISTNMSLDRIDSSKGYTEDNVQLVCVFANTLKSDKTLDELYYFCERILKNRGKH